MKKCPYCHADIDDDALYCPRCGTRQEPRIAHPPLEESRTSPRPSGTSGRSIAGFVLGIVSISFSVLFCYFFTLMEIFVFPGAVVGVVLSATSIRRNKSMSIIGLVLSAIAAVIASCSLVIWWILLLARAIY